VQESEIFWKHFALDIIEVNKKPSQNEKKFFQSMLNEKSPLKWKRKFHLVYQKIKKEKFTKSIKKTLESDLDKQNFLKTWKNYIKELKTFEKLNFILIKNPKSFRDDTIIGIFLYSYFRFISSYSDVSLSDDAFSMFQEIYNLKNVKTNLLVKNSEGYLTSFSLLSFIKDHKFVGNILKVCEIEFKIKKFHQIIYAMPNLLQLSFKNLKFLMEKVGKSDVGYFHGYADPSDFVINQVGSTHRLYTQASEWLDLEIETIEKLDYLCKITNGSGFDPSVYKELNTFTILKRFCKTKDSTVLNALSDLYKKYKLHKLIGNDGMTLDIFISKFGSGSLPYPKCNPEMLDFIYSEFELIPQLKSYLDSFEVGKYADLNDIYQTVKVMVKYGPDMNGIDLKSFKELTKDLGPRSALISIINLLIDNGCKDNLDFIGDYSFFDKICYVGDKIFGPK